MAFSFLTGKMRDQDKQSLPGLMVFIWKENKNKNEFDIFFSSLYLENHTHLWGKHNYKWFALFA